MDLPTSLGLAAISLGLIAVVFGGVQIFQISRAKKLGEDVAHDLEKLGEVTLKAIEKNGNETRSIIASVHKSIKDELSK